MDNSEDQDPGKEPSHEDSYTGKCSPKESSIRVDVRDSRSTPNLTLQLVIKSISSFILREKSPHPEGSPPLTPPKSAEKVCRISKAQIEDIWIYTFADPARKDSKEAKCNLYYFAGGGFSGPATKEHWMFCAAMCLKLPEYNINLVSYPLAPNNTAPRTLPLLQKLYKALLVKANEEGTTISFMGDSAGANLALVLGIDAATACLKNNGPDKTPRLRNIIALFPPTDLRNNNPEIDAVARKDKILSRKIIDNAAKIWHGEWDVTNPQLSPIFADLSVFKRANIKVDGMTAGHDVLTPDAIIFREKLAENGVDGDWLHWERQMHCFPLISYYHVHEAVAARDWLIEILASNAKMSPDEIT
ncbi:Esterase [Lachnellula suecica]|uniref:Esterase n=1 Tax=Lachnellula suecica TaxID=602035 RepID=A0A8T9BZF1_9HELO|nr:Esterase [Lachnellula suecica]